jgi:hypothetical protein
MSLESICRESAWSWASLAAPLVSTLLSLAALYVAWSSLSQAKQVAERAQRDWKQRTWYDLYFKADESYDALLHFAIRYPDAPLPGDVSEERIEKWNDLILAMRTMHRIAMVFPKNQAIDELVSATIMLDKTTQTISEEQRSKFFNAVDGIRTKALVDTSVLE